MRGEVRGEELGRARELEASLGYIRLSSRASKKILKFKFHNYAFFLGWLCEAM